jgi:hypothetical protein
MKVRDEQGLMGKLALLWLVLLALLVIATFDGVMIVSMRLHLANIATNAASEAMSAYQVDHDVAGACAVATATIKSEDAAAKLKKNGCVVDPATGAVTVSIRKPAQTILAGRLSFTKKLAYVSDTETDRPSGV